MTKDQFDRILSDAKSLYWEKADAETRADFVSKAKANFEFEVEFLRKQEAERLAAAPIIYWCKLEIGTNVVRLVTKPYQYLTHEEYVSEGDASFGQRLKCSAPFGRCALCDAGHKATPRWMFGIISRRFGNRVYYLDLGFKEFFLIQKLAQYQDWGDPTTYDINISVDQYDLSVAVIPHPKTELSEQDKELVKLISLDQMKLMSEPISPDILSNIIMDGRNVLVKSIRNEDFDEY